MSNQQEKNCNNYDEEISISEFLKILLRHIKLIVIVTIITTLLSGVYGFWNQKNVTYTSSTQLTSNKYSYYSPVFVSEYKEALDEYLAEEVKDIGNVTSSIVYTTGEENDKVNMLNLKYTDMQYDEAMDITQKVADRHNALLEKEIQTFMEEKEEAAETAYEHYEEAHDEYYDVLYDFEGYYSLKDELELSIENANLYKSQINSKERVLAKMKDGEALQQEDLYLYEEVSVEELEKEIEYLKAELKSAEDEWDELKILIADKSLTVSVLKNENDYAVKTYNNANRALQNQKDNLLELEGYYIDEFEVVQSAEKGLVAYMLYGIIFGIILAVCIILFKISF